MEIGDIEANIVRATCSRDAVVAYHKPDSQMSGILLGYMVPAPDSEHWSFLKRNDSALVEAWGEHYDVSYSHDDLLVEWICSMRTSN